MNLEPFYERRDNACPHGTNETSTSPISEKAVPEHGRKYIVPARQGRAVALQRGERILIRNPTGQQVCDAWAFNLHNHAEYLSWPHTHASTGKVIPQVGDVFVSNRRQSMLTFIEDTSPGVHDTQIAACDVFRYFALGADTYHDNCSDNLRLAVKAVGHEVFDVPQPFNIWMNIPISDKGEISWGSPVARAGDHVLLRAEMDVLIVLSACPQDMVPVNGAEMKPSEIEFTVFP